MPATKAAAERREEKSKAGWAEVVREARPQQKSSGVKKAARGRGPRKEEAAQRSIVAWCIKRIEQALKRVAGDEDEIRRLKEETRATLSRL